MIDEFKKMVYGQRILLDTNVLLLYLIGKYDRSQVEKVSRIKQYSRSHFEFLVWLLGFSKQVITTPHIMTEVVSLSPFDKKRHQDFLVAVKRHIESTIEIYEESITISQESAFPKYGLTDVGIYTLAKKEKFVVMTDDFPLSGLLKKEGLPCLNLSNIIGLF